jgi:hypothetical protein
MTLTRGICGLAIVAAIGATALPAAAQDGRDRDARHDALATLDRGMSIPVRTTEAVDASRQDYRVYTGVVDQDVRSANGGIAVPRGATAELMARSDRNGGLTLDLESVTVDGHRYAVKTEAHTMRSNDLVGTIVGAIAHGNVHGTNVNVPRDTVMTFRLEQGLTLDVPDQGVSREGHHYHDYYGRGRGGQ